MRRQGGDLPLRSATASGVSPANGCSDVYLQQQDSTGQQHEAARSRSRRET